MPDRRLGAAPPAQVDWRAFGQHFGRSYESVSYKYSYIKNTGRTGERVRPPARRRTCSACYERCCGTVAAAAAATARHSAHPSVAARPPVLSLGPDPDLQRVRRVRPSTPRPSMRRHTRRWPSTRCSRCDKRARPASVGAGRTLLAGPGRLDGPGEKPANKANNPASAPVQSISCTTGLPVPRSAW